MKTSLAETRSILPTYRFFLRRAQRVWLGATLSMGLILFFLGLFATMAIFGHKLARQVRGLAEMEVYLHDGPNPKELEKLQQRLESMPFVESLEYVSKEAAAAKELQRTGDNTIALMGGINPLPASFSIRLTAPYLVEDSLSALQKRLSQEYLVADVQYPMEIFMQLDSNIQILTWVSVVLGLLLVLVAILLVLQTIRSGIFSRRLSIRTMQLVGASPSYIRRPFLVRGLLQGGVAGLFASGGLLLVGLFLDSKVPQMGLEGNVASAGEFFGLLTGIILIGLALGSLASYWAVNRYLSRNLDEII